MEEDHRVSPTLMPNPPMDTGQVAGMVAMVMEVTIKPILLIVLLLLSV